MITLTRVFRTSKHTLGALEVDGLEEEFYTCELPDKGNKPNISCIPTGTYKITPHYAPTLKQHCFLVEGVVGREGILIHIANKPIELRGCIAVGMTGGNGGCWESRLAMDKLLEHIKEPTELVIKNLYHQSKF